ncbi:AraC family transcriptional regulator [Rhizobium laguerreae]
MSSSLLAAVTGYIEGQGGGEGLFPTPIDGFNIVRSCQAMMMPMRAIYRPSLCVVIQGGKEILFGDDMLSYGAMECLVVSVELPASGRIVEASPDAPYIGVTIDLDVTVMREVVEQLDEPPVPPVSHGPCMFVSQVDVPLADCIQRLVRLSETPKAIPILYPSIVREICFWLLNSPHGGELYRLALPRIEYRAGRESHLHAAHELRPDAACGASGRGRANEPVVVPSALQGAHLDDAAPVPKAAAPSRGKATDGG